MIEEQYDCFHLESDEKISSEKNPKNELQEDEDEKKELSEDEWVPTAYIDYVSRLHLVMIKNEQCSMKTCVLSLLMFTQNEPVIKSTWRFLSANACMALILQPQHVLEYY